MSPGRLPHPLNRVLALALSLAILLALGPAAAMIEAQAAPACAKSPRHGACALSAHTGKAHRRKAARHARHAKRPAAARRRRRAAQAAPVPVAALCEDASRPLDVGGAFSCADGSQPACADGSTPTAHGTSLLCAAAVEEGASPSEEGCEGEGDCEPGGEDAAAEEGTACEACEHPSVHEG